MEFCSLVQVISNRPDLKVVVMSATLDAEQFQKYFSDAPLMVRDAVKKIFTCPESTWKNVQRRNFLHART
jgi:hypothetical protein